MTLSLLIQKDGLAQIATATPATFATQVGRIPASAAAIATVAVAGTPDTHYRWLVTRPDAPPFEVCFTPNVAQAEVEACYLGAVAEPLPDDPCESGSASHVG